MIAGDWPLPLATDPKVLSKVRLGKGLIWRMTDGGLPLYDRLLEVAEVRNRIEQCWQPYHAAVEQAIEAAHARHGYSIHINCHSMPAIAGEYATDFPGDVHPDFVVGNRDETTSSGALARRLVDHLAAAGHSVAYNHPYKGVELVRRYGQPLAQRHSIQLEINRRLYMNEETLALNDGFPALKSQLESMVRMLLATDPRTL